MRQKDVELLEPVEDTAENHAGDGDGGLEREAHSKRQNMTVLACSRAVDRSREAVVRVQEDHGLGPLQSCVDGVQLRVVQTLSEAAGAHDDTFDVLHAGQTLNLLDDDICRGGEGQGPEGIQPAWEPAADAVHVVIDLLRHGTGLCGVQEVQPGIGERDDGNVNVVSVHELDFLLNIGVVRSERTASRRRRHGGIIFTRQDDEAVVVWSVRIGADIWHF